MNQYNIVFPEVNTFIWTPGIEIWPNWSTTDYKPSVCWLCCEDSNAPFVRWIRCWGVTILQRDWPPAYLIYRVGTSCLERATNDWLIGICCKLSLTWIANTLVAGLSLLNILFNVRMVHLNPRNTTNRRRVCNLW
jgi:hypothetical protein